MNRLKLLWDTNVAKSTTLYQNTTYGLSARPHSTLIRVFVLISRNLGCVG